MIVKGMLGPISDFFVASLKQGQPDHDGLMQSRLARVEHDGSTWFYDLPDSVTLEDFKIMAEVAWEKDCEYAEIWGSDGFARVVFE